MKNIMIFLFVSFTVLQLFLMSCSKPVGPKRFVSIRLSTKEKDKTEYTGVPVLITAKFDSAVSFDQIQWVSSSGRAKFVSANTSAYDGTTSYDSVWVTWEEYPYTEKPKINNLLLKQDSVKNNTPKIPVDTIWVNYIGNESNKVILTILNRAPIIDSIVINGRNITELKDSVTLSSNHNSIAYIKLYATDLDTSTRLNAEWIQHDTAGNIIKFEKTNNYSGVWNIRWQAGSVENIGDSTVISSAVIRVYDGKGGFAKLPIKIIVYRESGSIWLASTQENTSTLVKYASNGTELLRLPGFSEINRMAVNTSSETVWFTDKKAGKVYCVDDDGNLVHEFSGFTNPSAIDVNNQSGYCCVAYEDKRNRFGSYVTIINTSDTTSSQLRINGSVTYLKLNQKKLFDLWVLGKSYDTTSAFDYVINYNGLFSNSTNYNIAKDPFSMDINTVTDDIWIVDKGNNKVIKISGNSSDTTVISGFFNPHMIAVNVKDSTCWVADTDNNRVVKLLPGIPDGYNLETDSKYHKCISSAYDIDFLQPSALAVNSHERGNGVVWVVDTQNNRIVKLDGNTGNPLLSIADNYGMESSCFIAVNTGTK